MPFFCAQFDHVQLGRLNVIFYIEIERKEAMKKGERLLYEIEYFNSRNRSISATEIGDYFGVAKNTVQDDIDRLKNHGCIFEATDGRNGGYVLKSAPSLERLAVGEEKEQLLKQMIEEAKGEKKELLRQMTEELAIKTLEKDK